MVRACRMLVGLAVLASGAAAPPRAAAEGDGVREVATELAKKVREVAGGLKPAQTAVKIGLFTGSQDALALGAGGGPFMAELGVALAGFLDDKAPLELNGQVLFVDDPATAGLKVIKVKARLVDRNGDEPAEFKEFVGFVRKNADIARITGAPVRFKPDAEYEGVPPSTGRNKDIQDSLPPSPREKPDAKPKAQAHVAGTLVRSRADSPYAVEVRARPAGATGEAAVRTPRLENGLPFVDVARGEVYEVRVLNDSPREVAVSLTVDGIDQFTFSEDRKPDGRPRFSHWIVDPAKGGTPGEVLIVGWHKTADPKRRDSVASFLVTEYGKGAASRFPTQAQGKVGLITVGFALSYEPGSRNVGVETGFGPDRFVPQQVVERRIDAPHEFVTVRYAR